MKNLNFAASHCFHIKGVPFGTVDLVCSACVASIEYLNISTILYQILHCVQIIKLTLSSGLEDIEKKLLLGLSKIYIVSCGEHVVAV